MDNRNEYFRTLGILLGGLGLLLCGVGAVCHVFHQFKMSRAFVQHMEVFPSRVVSDIMATNGPNYISMSDENGSPWITFENKDKNETGFYRIMDNEEE